MLRLYVHYWKSIVDFSSRSRRKELWATMLFSFLVGIVFGLVFPLDESGKETTSIVGFVIMLIYVLAATMASIAQSIRRLHDRGHSGWWLLLAFVPFVNLVLFLYLLLAGSTEQNDWGLPANTIEI